MKALLLFCALSSVFFSVAVSKPQKWAVLVATTKSWLYYRHQSTVMHAYHTLIANGFNKDNIIVMFYDDLANNPKNTEKGVVRNHPFGDNLYPTVKKCYTGNKVNADTFLAVLAGDSETAKGPVLKSGPKDTVFIYVVGLGATQYMTFPTGPGISAQKFVAALKKLRSDKKAKKVLVFLETSFAASLVSTLLPRKGNIFVQTATHHNELPWAVYCDKMKRLCYGSLYGCAWTQRSDRLRQMKYGAKTSIWDYFNSVRTLTTLSHVNMFGHLEMGRDKISQFLDYKLVPRKQQAAHSSVLEKLALSAINEAEDKMDEEDELEMEEGAAFNADPKLEALYAYVGADDEKIDKFSHVETPIFNQSMVSDLEAAFMFAASENGENNAKARVIENREFVSEAMRQIFDKIETNQVNENKEELMKKFHQLPPLSEEQSTVYESAIKSFDELCFDMHENTFVQSELGKLAVLASEGVTLDELINAMKSVCSSHHRMARSIF